MRLEDAIKQKSFKDEYQKMVINIAYTSSWLATRQGSLFKEYDLSSQQFNILRILRGAKGQPLAMQDIAERMIDKMSNCSRLVEKLRIKNMLERKECPNDRRQVEILITERGLEVLRELDEKLPRFHEELHHLSKEEAATLNALLDKLRR